MKKLSGVERVLARIGDDRELLRLIADVSTLLARRRRKKKSGRLKHNLTRK